jgi:hypothetical protein
LAVDIVLDQYIPLEVHIVAYSDSTDLGYIPMGLGFWLPLLFQSRARIIEDTYSRATVEGLGKSYADGADWGILPEYFSGKLIG